MLIKYVIVLILKHHLIFFMFTICYPDFNKHFCNRKAIILLTLLTAYINHHIFFNFFKF